MKHAQNPTYRIVLFTISEMSFNVDWWPHTGGTCNESTRIIDSSSTNIFTILFGKKKKEKKCVGYTFSYKREMEEEEPL